MAFHDWNHDGEKDWKDNAIEYQLLKNMNKDEKPSYTPRSSSGMSGCGALVATIATIIITAALIGFFFGGDVSDVPRLASPCDIYYCGFGYKCVVRLKMKGR